MSQDLDHTHDPALRSWVESAHGHPDFPIQNLPFGIFSPLAGAPRGGIAIGDMILDLRDLAEAGLPDPLAQAACAACAGPVLNPFLALGAAPRQALRRAVSTLLAADSPAKREWLHAATDCLLYLPAQIGDYTDFYAGIHHATNVGRLFRPEAPLLPNYKFLPIGYHGRASSVRPSGAEIRRPHGQIKPPDRPAPRFSPCARLDYELELGIWVGPGNALGTAIPIDEATGHIAGYSLLNDWSARDMQAWEYQPLGPFLAKSFLTSLSPWIVSPEALSPFRIPQPPRPAGDPTPLPYLMDAADQQDGALAITLQAWLSTETMRAQALEPHRLSAAGANNLYWTPAQMLAHHASNGCNLNPGDLLGSGTISGEAPGSFGSLLEITEGGRAPVTLPTGETRTFLQDGDEVILRGRAERPGCVPIGFGECRGRVLG